jgi:hypothetical protein
MLRFFRRIQRRGGGRGNDAPGSEQAHEKGKAGYEFHNTPSPQNSVQIE